MTGLCLPRYSLEGQQRHLYNVSHKLTNVGKGLQQEESLGTLDAVGGGCRGRLSGSAERPQRALWKGTAHERSAIGLGVLGVSVSLSTVTGQEADLHALPSGSWLVRAQQSSSRTSRGEGRKEGRGMSAPGWLPPCCLLVWRCLGPSSKAPAGDTCPTAVALESPRSLSCPRLLTLQWQQLPAGWSPSAPPPSLSLACTLVERPSGSMATSPCSSVPIHCDHPV